MIVLQQTRFFGSNNSCRPVICRPFLTIIVVVACWVALLFGKQPFLLLGADSFIMMADDNTGYTGSGQNAKFASSSSSAEKEEGDIGEDGEQQDQPQPPENKLPLLPEPDPDANLPSIKLGETISFEEMGPVILNTDGTTRRIDNWDQLTEKEKEVTWRRIRKRNEQRRQQLLLQQQQQQKEESNKEDEGSSDQQEL